MVQLQQHGDVLKLKDSHREYDLEKCIDLSNSDGRKSIKLPYMKSLMVMMVTRPVHLFVSLIEIFKV